MEWDTMDPKSQTERRIAICSLGSGVGFRVASSLGRNGVSSSRRPSSNLKGDRDIDGGDDATKHSTFSARPSLSLYYLPVTPS